MPVCKLGGNPSRCLELDPMALVVVDGQRNDGEALLSRQAGANHRIEPAGEKDDGTPAHSLMPILGAAQNQPA